MVTGIVVSTELKMDGFNGFETTFHGSRRSGAGASPRPIPNDFMPKQKEPRSNRSAALDKEKKKT